MGVFILKVTGIGENVIGIFNYLSVTFQLHVSVTSCNFLTQMI